MTPRQNSLYWRLWGRLARQYNLGRGVTIPAGLTVLDRVQESAQAMAGANPPTANHWRHACHLFALGRPVSSRDLTGTDFDQVIALFRVLLDPQDLAAQERLARPEIQQRERYVFALRRSGFDESYIDTVARRKFPTVYAPPFWEDLPIELLQQLAVTVLSAGRRKAKKASHADAD